ncbi:MAG TPA: response regulator [Chloroflexota bacterium]|nr:response regulator [Chloroflexota bacterium]
MKQQIGMERMCVLVVDDDPDIREFVSDALAFDGYAVLTAGNGLEALRLLDQHHPHVVLLDLRMPVMDGPTFARRCWERFGDAIPIIAMSAFSRDFHLNELHLSGFLAKPFDLGDLNTLMAQFGGQPA